MFRRRKFARGGPVGPAPVTVRNLEEFEAVFGPPLRALAPRPEPASPTDALLELEHGDRLYLVDEHGEGWEAIVEQVHASSGTAELVVRADPRLEPDGRPCAWTIATAWDRGEGEVSLRWVQPHGDEEREHVVGLPLIVGGWS